MKIAIYNLHKMCEHNTLFLSRARRYFEVNNHRVTDSRNDKEQADLVFIGGCAVTDVMRNRCEETIRKIMTHQPRAQLVVFGCLTAFPAGLTAMTRPGREMYLIPYRQSHRLDELIGADVAFENINVNHLQGHVPYQPRMGADDAYVLISQGCVNDCSYCTIKKAKGAVLSRPEAVIEAEVDELYRRGIRSVTLLADDCGSFGYDIGSDLPGLLGRLCRTVPDMRFKIYTMFPALFLEQARHLEPFFAAGRVSYLCLPVQSGAPRILKLMNREYDPGQLVDAIARLRRLDSTLFVYSHFIYNFPTETIQEFEQSVALAQHFNHCVFIGYGENRGTRAAAISPKCDDQQLHEKTRCLDQQISEGRLAAFVVPST